MTNENREMRREQIIMCSESEGQFLVVYCLYDFYFYFFKMVSDQCVSVARLTVRIRTSVIHLSILKIKFLVTKLFDKMK
jgi:hypothetical protein